MIPIFLKNKDIKHMSFTWLSSINLVNLITWFNKKASIANKITKKAIISYKT
jgi:hypothetical protein